MLNSHSALIKDNVLYINQISKGDYIATLNIQKQGSAPYRYTYGRGRIDLEITCAD
ncbi:hypothetical protein N9N67_01825 [Bacteriovoracaceae bacterium]|nr:hypothetical protein [Bacteriovoracaceae bacterium]